MQGIDGTDVNDASTRFHNPAGFAAAEKYAAQIHTHGFFPEFQIHFHHRLGGKNSGIVHHDVERAKFFYCFLDKIFDVRFGTDVGFHEKIIAIFHQISNDHIRARLSQTQRDAAANAHCPASYNGCFACKIKKLFDFFLFHHFCQISIY